jgi:hypothetical protein
VILLTPYYRPASAHRSKELAYCGMRNRGLFDRIILLCDCEPPPDHPSQDCVRLDRRPRFGDAVQFIADAGIRDQVIVVSNSDIYHDETIKNAMLMEAGVFWCLSRYQHSSRLGFKSQELGAGMWSQDSWVFRSPGGGPCTRWGFFAAVSDLEFGRPGIDNVIAYQALIAGYRVVNPSRSVKIWHVHDDYAPKPEADRIYGTYYLPKPVFLGSGPQVIGEVTDEFARRPVDVDPATVC